MKNNKVDDKVIANIVNHLTEIGYKLSEKIQTDPIPEAKQYDGATFKLNNKKCVYRKGKVTVDRPGAFLALWKRPLLSENKNNKPVPLTQEDIEYLFIKVEAHTVLAEGSKSMDVPKIGVFIFPVALLIDKGIIASVKHKGKTGFRVFPPWSGDRGNVLTKVFSASGKKTQSWQLPYFVEINEDVVVDPSRLSLIFK